MITNAIHLKRPLFITSLLLVNPTFAHNPNANFPVEFEQKDWQLVCDNTRTCRAVGYQTDNNSDSVSDPIAVQFTREAGTNQAVQAKVFINSDSLPAFAVKNGKIQTFALNLFINHNDLGKIAIHEQGNSTLSAQQTQALLAAVQGKNRVIFTNGSLSKKFLQWELSIAGPNAVLLKMDEVQGRVGTVGAII